MVPVQLERATTIDADPSTKQQSQIGVVGLVVLS